MDEKWNYIDLLKVHKILMSGEGRFKYYSVYMSNRKPNAWLELPDVPLKEVLLLFGWVHSWDPNYEAETTKFLEEYKKVFPLMKSIEGKTIIDIKFTKETKNNITNIFDTLADCCRIPWRKKVGKFESTDTSKSLHGIIPELFVMWDDKIKIAIFGYRGDGKFRGSGKYYRGDCYAYEFLPLMQSRAVEVLESFIKVKGGNETVACESLSRMSNGYTLAKLLDEFNYLRFTKEWSITQIRAGKKDDMIIDFKDLEGIL